MNPIVTKSIQRLIAILLIASPFAIARIGFAQNATRRPVMRLVKDHAVGSGTLDSTASSNQTLTATNGDADHGNAMDWWHTKVTHALLPHSPRWVTFDLETILLDTLQHSPRIQAVSFKTSVQLEKIVQQDAAFDSSVLFDTQAGRTNDPVGNALITGGPPRLIEESLTMRGGIQRTTRRGTQVGLSQELGLLDSNSTFFLPPNQGNSRLSLSLTQPLLSRSGQVYNERLLTQARIDAGTSWQEMRGEVERRIADVVAAYWRLYELRCHLLQQTDLLERGKSIESIIEGRRRFDAGRIELAKARQRVARRADRRLQMESEVRKQQTRFASLVGAEALQSDSQQLEFIPLESPIFPNVDITLRDAVAQGLANRPEIKSAAKALESAALEIQVTRAELVPQWTAVVETYLMGLNGDYNVFQSLTDQFSRGGPGVSAGLQYDMPYGRRAARSRHRQAQHRYQQRAQELREAMQLTRAEIETALIEAQTAMAQQTTKMRLLETARDEEDILTRRWEMMGGDGAAVGTVLETLLDAQQRRTDAEREWISAQTRYLTALIDLQRAMGTLLIHSGIQPVQINGGSDVQFITNDETVDGTLAPVATPTPNIPAIAPRPDPHVDAALTD